MPSHQDLGGTEPCSREHWARNAPSIRLVGSPSNHFVNRIQRIAKRLPPVLVARRPTPRTDRPPPRDRSASLARRPCRRRARRRGRLLGQSTTGARRRRSSGPGGTTVFRPWRAARNAAWTACSLAASKFEAASSKIMTAVSWSSARAMPSRCRCPPDRRAPFSPTNVSYPSGSAATNSSGTRCGAAAAPRRAPPRPGYSDAVPTGRRPARTPAGTGAKADRIDGTKFGTVTTDRRPAWLRSPFTGMRATHRNGRPARRIEADHDDFCERRALP
jgi:hypothetical protein